MFLLILASCKEGEFLGFFESPYLSEASIGSFINALKTGGGGGLGRVFIGLEIERYPSLLSIRNSSRQ